LMSNYYRTATF